MTAWYSVLMLSEHPLSSHLAPSNSHVRSLYCESRADVDDLLVRHTNDGVIYIQAKSGKALSLSEKTDSKLADTLDQFVRQYLASGEDAYGPAKWKRPIDPEKDKFVIAIDEGYPNTIKSELKTALNKVRDLTNEQTLQDVACNQKESIALEKVKEHLSRIWRGHSGQNIDEADLRRILSMIHVEVFQLDDGEPGREFLISLLGNNVLADRTRAGEALGIIERGALSYISSGAGADRHKLEKLLSVDNSFRLKTVPSYQPDINKLKSKTLETSQRTAKYSRLNIGAGVHIERQIVTELEGLSADGNILVVGDPGAGKSGVMHELASRLTARGEDVLFIEISQYAAQDMADLRAKLDLDHEFAKALREWKPKTYTYLLLDGLDAARKTGAMSVFRQLIEDASQMKHVRIIASIRIFDLLCSTELPRLFPCRDGEQIGQDIQCEQLPRARHLKVGDLSDVELADAKGRSSVIESILNSAPPDLLNLLRNPFNLNITSELVSAGARVESLNQISHQMELLDMYWEKRVLDSPQPGEGYDRETMLKKAIEQMVNDKAMQVNKSALLTSSGEGRILDDILSRNLLRDVNARPSQMPEGPFEFPHHILFDYSVARLYLRKSCDDLISIFETDPDIFIAYRPSIEIHLRHLWHHDRPGFWLISLGLVKRDTIPAIGQIIAPQIVAHEQFTVDDLEKLKGCLITADGDIQASAEKFLKFWVIGLRYEIQQAKLSLKSIDQALLFLDSLTEHLVVSTAYSVINFLNIIIDREDIGHDDDILINRIARAVLTFFWGIEPRQRWPVESSIESVVKSFGTCPEQSRQILSQIIKTNRITSFGYEELRPLTNDLEYIADHDPDFIYQIYSAAFSYKETRKDPAPWGGILISLVSHISQDYDMNLWRLKEYFPRFIEQYPLHATGVLASVLASYGKNEWARDGAETEEKPMELNGATVAYKEDWSEHWDDHDPMHQNELEMLQSFDRYLASLLERSCRAPELDEIFNYLLFNSSAAVFWRRLFRLALIDLEHLGKRLVLLLSERDILLGDSIQHEVANLLNAIFSHLTVPEREQIEIAILSLAKEPDGNRTSYSRHSCDRYLSILPENLLQTEKARERVLELKKDGEYRGFSPRPRVRAGAFRPDEDELSESYYKNKGFKVEQNDTKELLLKTKALESFNSEHLNKVPTVEICESIFIAITELFGLLGSKEMAINDPEACRYSLGILAETCNKITYNESINLDNNIGKFVYTLLTTLKDNPDPKSDTDAKRNSLGAWGMPAIRISVADAFPQFLKWPGTDHRMISDYIRKYSRDGHHGVRYQITRQLVVLFDDHPDLVWDIVEDRVNNETSTSVLAHVVHFLDRIYGNYPDRVCTLLLRAYQQISAHRNDHPNTGLGCVSIIFSCCLNYNISQACDFIFHIISNPTDDIKACQRILWKTTNLLTIGSIAKVEADNERLRKQSIDIFTKGLGNAATAFRDKVADYNEKEGNVVEAEIEKLKELHHMFDFIAMWIKSCVAGDNNKPQKRKRPSPEIVARFLDEAGPALEILADIESAQVSHHMLEALKECISVKPDRVFLLVKRVMDTATRTDYQYDKLGQDLVVGIVKNYLSDYRDLLREKPEHREALRSILDHFIRAGWPEAIRLTYSLSEIFR